VEGNPIPVNGGIVLDMQQMNKVLAIRHKDFQADLEPGITHRELNKKLRGFGLFFPPDPGASATIGGMIANNAKGIRTVKYGSTKDYILKLEVILPDGEIVKLGTNTTKSSSGYNLCQLFCGSEGTLGVITEITLRLVGLPQEFMAAVATFDSVERATNSVFQIMISGIEPAALELLDSAVIRAINRDKRVNLKEKPTLLMEFHGASRLVLEQDLKLVAEICHDNGCLGFDSGIGKARREELWGARYNAFDSIKRDNLGASVLLVDTAVPLSKLGEMVQFSQEALQRIGVKGYIFGHAGDGNIHLNLIGNPDDKLQWGLVQRVNEEIVNHALDLGGTATGEHGVGVGKGKFMLKEHGSSLRLMKKVKQLLDPQGIMNPGKIFE
jgi:D-lactate dehydrogenase (cytochrome)